MLAMLHPVKFSPKRSRIYRAAALAAFLFTLYLFGWPTPPWRGWSSAGTRRDASCASERALSDAEPMPEVLPVPTECRVLITGGAGYIGSHMALLLLTQPSVRYSVVIVDDLSRGSLRHIRTLSSVAQSWNRSLTFVESDVGSVARMAAVMREHRTEVVIHFAGFAYASESVRQPLQYFDNTVTATQHLLAAMDEAGVRRLVYSSSSATYGAVTDDSCDAGLNEQSPQKPLSPYGAAKLMAEQIIRAYANSLHLQGVDFSAALLRYFNVIGADRHLRVGPLPKPHLAAFGRIVDSCFDSALSGRPLNLFGDDYDTHDGSPVRDYIHVTDLVDAHLQLTRVVHGRQVDAYNIGIGAGSSVKEVVSACESITGRRISVRVQPRRIGDPPVVLGDPSKLMRVLGWRPRHTDLTDNIRSGWRWRQMIAREEASRRGQERLQVDLNPT